MIISKHINLCKLKNQTRTNTIAAVGGWYNTWHQGCFLLLNFFLYFRLLLSHIHNIYVMGTPRASTNVRVQTVVLWYRRCVLALLSFVWFALFAASVAVVAFCPSVSSFVFPYVVHVLFLFFLLFMSSGEGGMDPVPFRCCRWSSICCPFCIVRSPCDVLVSWIRVLLLLLCWKSVVSVNKGN